MARKRRTRRGAAPATSSATTADASAPKTTRPPATERRPPAPAATAAQKLKRKLDAVPDRIDIRDWFYQPNLRPLPDQVVNRPRVPVILDQGQEGACTGFALAAVINFQLGARNLLTPRDQQRIVSPRMLYEMARRHDEWPGEGYDGSSARGAMKGWVAHGVARRATWPDGQHGHGHLTHAISKEAQLTPGGAYYRVMHRNIRDMHAALSETGILYATLMVHEGWGEPGPRSTDIVHVLSDNLLSLTLPIISRKGRATSGHAVAIVGYTRDGFVIQNSWGESWGHGGFALLPYEDWMLHATDCWVAQLGVPVSLDVWEQSQAADTTAGLARATATIPLSDIRPYVVDIGNNGRLSDSGDYWTTEEDIERLFESIQETSAGWSKRRIMLFLHGGLNDEVSAARRIVAYRDVCLENEIYPVHIMWESGFWESLHSSILDVFTNEDERAGANWLDRLRGGVVEAKDWSIEPTAASLGTVFWDEMKENAELASASKDGGMRIFVKKAAAMLSQLTAAERKEWELHVVGHSAGAIFAAYAIEQLIGLGMALKSFQLMAPAIRIDLFKELILPHVASGDCPQPTLYLLSDVAERDDEVSAYGKSLLYLVSNAFEGSRETPLLGMERFVSSDSTDENKDLVDADIEALFQQTFEGEPSLIVAGTGDADGEEASPSLSRSDTHGGFDNDEYTMNSVLYRILGAAPTRQFTNRDLQF